MVNEYQIRVQPYVAASEEGICAFLSKEYGFDVRTITAIRVLRKSIDARQRMIYVNLKVRVYINEEPADQDKHAAAIGGHHVKDDTPVLGHRPPT